MKLFAALCAAGLLAMAQSSPRPAPDLTIHMVGSPDLKLSAYRGHPVLLAFLNTGCTHCQHFAQEMAGFEKDYGPKGLKVLAVVFDKEAKSGLARFREQFVKGYPVGYSDEETVLNWLKQRPEDGYFVPIVAFIDRRGTIVSQHLGDDNLFQDPEVNIRKNLDRLLKR
ncbi:MAG: TlpA family protein disulfide reductase [Acidobacteriota bacterium]|nr:TlpA family protein disulfide reductase [Acidobacteriota bacterium]